ncbi:MAG: peptide ABC transporter permease [Cycloclasticus sp. symbiont of Poecilosclerida sp. M]|nr:MAG: peptide ABC transporter permease [Cycloclasticus sp. symbiont of Poecilosclerida sp. M]
MLALLWSDILIFLLIGGLVLSAYFASKQEQTRRPWRKAFQSRVGTASFVVLLVFLLVGLLDSIHIKQSESLSPSSEEHTEVVLSVLDIFLTPLRTQIEKTYSAPFSSFAYAKEISLDGTGVSVWTAPRLSYGGAHLEHPQEEIFGDVLQRSLLGLLKGIAAWCVLLLVLAKGPNVVAFINRSVFRKTALYTLLGLLLIIFVTAELVGFYHILGTDKVGEDVLYQALKSVRTGLIIGSLTTLVMLPIAITLGLLAGFFRGWVDDAIQYIYTTLSSIPSVLLIAAAILMAQVYMANNPELFSSVAQRADMRLLLLCVILGLTSWTGLCRLLRAETLKIREMDYVQAAQALGVRKLTILKRHILPNVMHLVMITVVLDFSGLVLAEAVLSYINIGVDPSTYSWGNMINSARLEMAREPIVWWSLAASFIFMFGLVLAANLFADAVRDAFDPRSKH